MCEIFEQLPVDSSDWYSTACDTVDFDLFEAYFKCMLPPDDVQLKNLTDLVKDENRNDAAAGLEMLEDFQHLGVAVLGRVHVRAHRRLRSSTGAQGSS